MERQYSMAIQHRGWEPVAGCLGLVANRWIPVLWTDGLSVGDPAIDGEHKRLLDLYNALVTAVNDAAEARVVQGLMNALFDFLDYHFDHEEQVMLANAYPDYISHKRVHDAFLDQLENVENHLEAGGHMGGFLLDTVAEWLVRHIQEADAKLGAYLLQRRQAA